MLCDLQYAFRQLRKNPGFTAAVVLILALGIGANTAIFTVIDAVMLSALPVKDPQNLVFLSDPNFHGVSIGGGWKERPSFTYPEFADLQARNSVFDGLVAASAGLSRIDATIEGSGASIPGGRVLVSMVSGNYFSVLGVRPVLGNIFTPEVDRPRDSHPVAVISYAYWQTQLGGAPDVLTRQIRLNATSFTIIGVAQAGFFGETFGAAPALWVPLSMEPEISLGTDYLSAETHPSRKTLWLQVIGRLKPGISVAQARAGIETTFQQYLETQASELPASDRADFLGQQISLTDGRYGASSIRHSVDAPLLFLMALVALLLLVACANVANLLLARATVRQKEIAIRAALGATAGRIVRQLLTESLVLSAAGGAAGLLFARWGIALLLLTVGNLGNGTAGAIETHLDAHILLFTLGVSLLVGIFFGAAPAVSAARVNLGTMLKGVGQAAKAGRFSLGKSLVIAQIALSLLLLIIAGLFVRSFQKLAAVNLGYDRDHLLVFDVPASAAGFKSAETGPIYAKLSERLRATPGVRGVTYSMLGLLGGAEINLSVSVEGQTESGRDMSANSDHVGPNYFSTLGIPVLSGREIDQRDENGGQRVTVINRTMAQYYFGDADPVGQRIRTPGDPGSPPIELTIVGVVADAKYHRAKEQSVRRFYTPFSSGDAVFEVRSIGDPSAIANAIRATVKRAAPSLPTVGVGIISQVADRQLSPDLSLAKLSGLFSILAAILASTGIYGLTSYSVARRTREVGIRMALGAQRGAVLWLILRETFLLSLAGVLIGVPIAIGASRLLSNLLFGLGLADGAVLMAAVALMILVAAAAGYLPARRATKVDPMIALRME